MQLFIIETSAYQMLNSFLASGNLCHMLITFANGLGSKMFDNQKVFLKEFFENNNFEKKKKKAHMKFPSMP